MVQRSGCIDHMKYEPLSDLLVMGLHRAHIVSPLRGC